MEPLAGGGIENTRIFNQPYPSLIVDSSFKGDEGYSEETRSQDDGDSTMGLEPRSSTSHAMLSSPLLVLQNAIMGLDETQRSEHAYAVLRTLRTSSIAAIVERLTPLLHLDPVAKLPPDLTSMIFSYLSPAYLLEASIVSKAWRERTLDSSLWREKFRREGWVLDMGEVWKYEQSYKPRTLRKTLSRKAGSHEEERRQKRRARHAELSDNRAQPRLHSRADEQSTQTVPSTMPLVASEALDQEMYDAEPSASNIAEPSSSHDHMDTEDSFQPPDTPLVQSPPVISDFGNLTRNSTEDSDFSVKDPPLVLQSYSGSARVNFHHVYKQKRRLEENWTNARYKSFQLPHRDHPEEAHSECVYTIQYSGSTLVSGSRDKTLRIWNLDTQRLARRPLEGHMGSVLCLQFDASESEDLIVSGSSDTDVILWQFSTGKMLKRIQNAHQESVLNLKFDRRFLVTCSKDKMIKIWNRRELKPGDVDYPKKGLDGGGKCPSYILDMDQIPDPVEVERLLNKKVIEVIPEYSLIMRIDTHGAAVNAVHIYRDQLVSASGDRALRVFDIHSGVCMAFCKGHTKGIACVQYDGKRIVSGSSDDTIRIFDPISQAEVACLQGHSKLVRTVQAAFGDCPGTEEDLQSEALVSDRSFFTAANASRTSSGSVSSRRSREENPGANPADRFTTLGAKLPPGGGGSPWARIVSGSYDETVIIWKKAPDGHWTIGHVLKQAEALQAVGGPLIAQSERKALATAANGTQALLTSRRRHITPQTHDPVGRQAVLNAQAGPSLNSQVIQHNTPMTSMAGPSSQTSLVPNPPAVLHQALMHQLNLPQLHLHGSFSAATSSMGLPLQYQQQQRQQQPQPQQPPRLHQSTQDQHVLATAAAPAANGGNSINHSSHNAAFAAATILGPNPNLNPNRLDAARAQAQAQAPAYLNAHPNARVFKLQFDARRIICCSQDPKIVGWDFADGDEEIVECSRFFGNPQ